MDKQIKKDKPKLNYLVCHGTVKEPLAVKEAGTVTDSKGNKYLVQRSGAMRRIK